MSRIVRWSWAVWVLSGAAPFAGTALAFVFLLLGIAPQDAARWNAVAGPEGAVVTVDVAIEETAAEELTLAVTGGTDPVDVAAAQASIAASFAAWASPVLRFNVIIGGAVEGTTVGSDIDVFAVPSTHPVFGGTPFFGVTFAHTGFNATRLLTNGTTLGGTVIDGADIYLNVDRIALIAPIFTDAQRPRALQRLMTHEVGHALGLHHPNEYSSFNLDTDTDPLNRMIIDPVAPFDDLVTSTAIEPNSIMSNLPAALPTALTYTTLRFDERGGRDVLYPSPIPAPGCDPSPRTNCRTSTEPLKSIAKVQFKGNGKGDLIKFVWGRGEATDAGAFGNPLGVDAFTLCVYDQSATGVVYRGDAPTGGTCGTKPCWKARGDPAGSKGYAYVDKEATPHGVRKMLLKPGAAGKAKVAVEAKGSLVSSSPTLFPTLPLVRPVQVQVQATNGECFGATFGTALRNDEGQFKAKSD